MSLQKLLQELERADQRIHKAIEIAEGLLNPPPPPPPSDPQNALAEVPISAAPL